MWKGLLIFGLLICCGCAPSNTAIRRDLDSADAMRSEILVQIPPGMSVADAIDIMERNQFDCERRSGTAFETEEFHRDAFDHILCRRTDKAGPGQVRCWQVALELHDEAVTDAFVKISYTGK